MPADVELSVSVTKKGDGADKVGRDLKEAARAADRLDDDLKAVNRQLIEMKLLAGEAAKQFKETGDSSPLKQVLKDQRELQKVEKSLAGARDELRKMDDEGKKVAKTLSDRLVDAAEDLPLGIGAAVKAGLANPEFIAIGGAVAAPLAAGLAAALGGATLAATGAVGLAGGILLAAKDQRVHAAWVAFANEAGQDLQEASSVFAKPLAAAATTVGDAFHDIMPLIEKDFATLAPVVDHLAKGAAGFIKAFAPGFSSGLQAGAKVFAQFADELPGLGAAVGVFFDELAAGAEGGGSALVTTLRVTEFAVEGLGVTLHSASDAFVLFGGTAEFATGKLNDGAVAGIVFGSGLIEVAGHLVGLDDKTKQSSKSQDEFFHKMEDAKEAAKAEAQAQRENAAAIDEARNAIKNMINDMLGLDGATLNFNKSLLEVTDAVKQNGRSLSEHTEKGIANRQALLNGVSAAEKLREEMINSGQSTAYANSVYEQNIQKLKDAAKNAKLNATEVQNLIDKYGNLAKAPDIAKTITITERFKQVGQRTSGQNIGGGGQGFSGAAFALGGPVKAPAGMPVPAIVHGGEYVLSQDMLAGRQPLTGLDTLVPSARAPLAGVPSGGGTLSGAAAPVLNYSGSTAGLDGLFLSWLQKQIRNGYLTVS